VRHGVATRERTSQPIAPSRERNCAVTARPSRLGESSSSIDRHWLTGRLPRHDQRDLGRESRWCRHSHGPISQTFPNEA
jgi:hypothetical protein